MKSRHFYLGFPRRMVKSAARLAGLALLAATVSISLPAERSLAAEKLTVLLDYFINPDHAPLFVAKYIGAYEDEGLDVEFVPPADPNAPPRLVAAGQADLALSYQPVLHMLAEENVPVIRVGTLIDTPLTTLVTLKDGPIKTLKDLEGKKVGYSISGFEEATLGTMLKTVDLDMKDVTMVNVNFQLVTSLMSHQVDAVLGAYRNFEVNELKEHKVAPQVFYPEENGVPMYDELILLANRDKAADPRFPKFLAAVEKGTYYLLNHPDECWEMFIKDHPDLNNPLNKTAWYETLSRFDKHPGELDAKRYESFADFLLKASVIKKKVPLDQYAVELK